MAGLGVRLVRLSIFLGHLNETPQRGLCGAANGLQSNFLARISQTLSADKLWRANDHIAFFALALEMEAVLDSQSIHGLHCLIATEITTVNTVAGLYVPAERPLLAENGPSLNPAYTRQLSRMVTQNNRARGQTGEVSPAYLPTSVRNAVFFDVSLSFLTYRIGITTTVLPLFRPQNLYLTFTSGDLNRIST